MFKTMFFHKNLYMIKHVVYRKAFSKQVKDSDEKI